LIIGDSISMGYTLRVRELLKGVANVHRIPENGGSTRDGLQKLDRWLGAGKWDVIHFNWGLHDLKHWKDGKLDLAGPQMTPVELYEANVRELMVKLKSTNAALIFATTTPVPAGSAGRESGDEIGYNEAARRVMEEAKVPHQRSALARATETRGTAATEGRALQTGGIQYPRRAGGRVDQSCPAEKVAVFAAQRPPLGRFGQIVVQPRSEPALGFTD
jgi:hypothetical protein